MGNASSKNDGEGITGEFYDQGDSAEPEPMLLHSPPPSPRRFLQPPPIFVPQVPMVPLARPAEIMHTQNYALGQNTSDSSNALSEKENAVMITWSYEGKQVAVTGSWDNWDKREPLHRSGKDFVIMKMLPSGVFRYRYIVDEHLTYAPELPWECDDSGIAYNVLDVQEDVPEAPESLAEFELPPSPGSSYNNETFKDDDFSKHPPEIPPHLQLALLNNRSSAVESPRTLPRPWPAVLNHLYIQNNQGQPVALGSTHRFLQKYVTVVLYKPSRR
ncbi:SNF1-related protein kinase regulatory subunit beta-2-like isoform X2 [Euphorbia lathyris]|uniref:SNF1-related protein kinase regulatory subunit beta-2-like isoform X2 n=1 Tax=Euphorbia lathyris TaxID=212925 RepID=UPI00331447CA